MSQEHNMMIDQANISMTETNLISNDPNEIELLEKISIKTWAEYPRKHNTILEGDPDDIMKYYNNYILKMYPNNPYFTRIEREDENSLHIVRSTTCS